MKEAHLYFLDVSLKVTNQQFAQMLQKLITLTTLKSLICENILFAAFFSIYTEFMK